MTSIKSMLLQNEAEINYLGLVNDALAALYVCVTINMQSTALVDSAVLVMFCMVTFINVYLHGAKAGLVMVWGFAFFGFCIISSLWAYSASGAMSLSRVLIKRVLLVFFLNLYTTSFKKATIVLKSVVISGVILLARLLFSAPLSQWGSSRLGSNIGLNPNSVGIVCVFAALLCLQYSDKRKIYYLGFSAFTVAALFSGSRKAFISLFIVIFMYFINKIKKPSRLFYLAPLLALFYLLYYFSMNNPMLYHMLGRRMEYLFNYFRGEGDIGESVYIRMDLISIGIEQFKSKMLFGYGINSFQYMNRYNYYAHNNYIEILVNYGIMGIVLFYGFQAAVFLKLCYIWLTQTREIIFLVITMVVIFVNDYGRVSYYSPLNIIMLVVSCCIVVLYSQGGDLKFEKQL